MGAEEGAERRRAPRIAQTFVVKYHWEEDGQPKWGLSQTKDLSATGLRFVADRLFPVGALLDFEIRVSTMTEPLKVKGKVVWVKPLPLIPTAEHGIEFAELDDATKHTVQRAVEFFHHHS